MTRSTGGRSPIPRPLQLGEISVTRSTSSSPSALSSDAKQDNRRPMPLRTRTIDRQPVSSPHSPLTTEQRRQSSISYYSPTAESLPPSSPLAGPGPSSLSRSKSVGQRPKPVRNDSLAKRASVPSRAVLERAEERGPLTLVEKHADLLQFIAQKEAKCMDLRTQLAAHEAELAQLKKKWERIVNRGLERANSTSLPAIQAPSPSLSSNAGVSTPNAATVTMLDGLQGVGRLLVAGLSDFSSPLSPPSVPPLARRSSNSNIHGSISRRINPPLTHQSTQSVSSTSTTASTMTSKSTRFSQSSASSLESSLAEEEKDVTPRGSASHASGPNILVSPQAERNAKALRRRSREGKTSVTQSSASLVDDLGRDSPPLAGEWTRGRRPTDPAPNKRGSLLADVGQLGQSFLASLAGGGVSPVEPPSRPLVPPFARSTHTMSRALASSASLIDDDDDAWALASAGSAVLVPARAHVPKAALKATALSRPSSAQAHAAAQGTSSSTGGNKVAVVDDFDDWNW